LVRLTYRLNVTCSDERYPAALATPVCGAR
jgi:hypothetical protein